MARGKPMSSVKGGSGGARFALDFSLVRVHAAKPSGVRDSQAFTREQETVFRESQIARSTALGGSASGIFTPWLRGTILRSGAGSILPEAESELARAGSERGEPLPKPLRGQLEKALGYNLSEVRVHMVRRHTLLAGISTSV